MDGELMHRAHGGGISARILLALVLAGLLPVLAEAVGPIYSPATCKLTWTAPTQNADGTPLTDLAGYRMYIGTQPGESPISPTAVIPAPNPAPALNTQMVWPCTGITTDGQKYAVVRPYDFAGNEASLSNEFAFFFATTAPATVTGLSVSP